MSRLLKALVGCAVFHCAIASAPAPSRSTVQVGKVRITVLTDRLLRLEYSSSGVFDDRMTLTVVNRALPFADFNFKVEAGVLVLSTSALRLEYIGVLVQSPFSVSNLKITYKGVDGAVKTWTPGTPLNPLNGTFTQLDCYSGPMACVSDWWNNRMSNTASLLSRDGPVLVDDSNTGRLTPNGTTDAQTLMPYPWFDSTTVASTYQDWYFHTYMSNYTDFLGVWSNVSGPIAMPRRSALGLWWSRWYPYTQDSIVADVLQGYADYGLPLSVLVLDTDWHETDELAPGCNTDGNLDFSTQRFPNPQPFVNAVRSGTSPIGRPLELTLNVKPSGGIDYCDDRYPAIARAMGIDPSTNVTVRCDMSNQTYVRAVYDNYYNADPLSAVSTWWTDYTGCSTGIGDDALLWGNAIFDCEVRYNPNVSKRMRPQVLSRNGGLGSQRYPLSFSGDTYQHEVVLDFLVQATPMASHAMIPYWSHDVGGFMGQGPGAYTPAPGSPGDATPSNFTGVVLLLRWFQFGALSPIMRTHCDHCIRTIWDFPDAFSLLKDAMLLRHALVSYLYTAARSAYDTGVPLLRPMHFGWPSSDEAHGSTRQYMLGSTLLVAPITTVSWAGNGGAADNSTSRSVWLPPLANTSRVSSLPWCPWAGRSACLPGGSTVTVSAGLGDVPMFVPAGTIMPLAHPNLTNVDAPSPDLLWVYWSPVPDPYLPLPSGTQYTTTQLYEDDGSSLQYETSTGASTIAAAELRIPAGPAGQGSLTFTISPVQAPYQGMRTTRAHSIQLRGIDPSVVASVGMADGPLPQVNPPTSIQSAPVRGWYVVPPALHSLLYPSGSIVVHIGSVPRSSTAFITVQLGKNAAAAGGPAPAVDPAVLGGGIGGGVVLLAGLVAGVLRMRSHRMRAGGKRGGSPGQSAWETVTPTAAATAQAATV